MERRVRPQLEPLGSEVHHLRARELTPRCLRGPMPDALDDAADEARQRFRIPPVHAPEHRSSIYDGWYVTARGARFIGLIRSYDVDLRPGPDHVEMQPRLLARELMEHMADERISTHVSRSFAAMDAAGHHLDDQAIVLAI